MQDDSRTKLAGSGLVLILGVGGVSTAEQYAGIEQPCEVTVYVTPDQRVCFVRADAEPPHTHVEVDEGVFQLGGDWGSPQASGGSTDAAITTIGGLYDGPIIRRMG
jgi:hypothetical protein